MIAKLPLHEWPHGSQLRKKFNIQSSEASLVQNFKCIQH